MKNTKDIDLSQLTDLIPSHPEFPITGKGNMRCAFPFIRRKNGFGQRVWNAIPNEHKFVLSYGDGSSLRYRGVGSNVIISPEAYDAMKQMSLV